jgi:hypothetical protein
MAGAPAFLYHSGAVATFPGEVLTIRLFYRDLRLWPAKVAVSSFSGEGCESVEVLRSTSRRGILPGSIGQVEVKIHVTSDGECVLQAAVVQLRGGSAVIPIGHVKVVSKTILTSEDKIIALKESFSAVPDRRR